MERKHSVLVYPNITYAKNLEADSFVVVLGNIIRALDRDDLEYTVLLPDFVDSLDLPNVRQEIYELPTYPNTMRCHFDPKAFLSAVDWRHRSYDIVWSHLPEHTVQIKNVLYNSTNERPMFVGYCHWWEIPEAVTFAANTLPLNFAGILEMLCCGVNSKYLADLVVRHAEDYVSTARLDKLCDILEPQYLGCQPPVTPRDPKPGRLVFNHRMNTYTGLFEVLDALDALWTRRQDFEVVFTLGDIDKPYAVPRGDLGDRSDYLGFLSECWAGLPRLRTQWSVSIQDCFSAGCPPILPNAWCHPEMVDLDYRGLCSADAPLDEAFSQVLDWSPEQRATAAAQAQDYAARGTWSRLAYQWEQMFEDAIEQIPTMGDRSRKYADVKALAEAGATKAAILKQMGWGVGIPWTPYRNRLRAEGIPTDSIGHGDYAQSAVIAAQSSQLSF